MGKYDKIIALMDDMHDTLNELKQATNPALYAEECRRKSHNKRIKQGTKRPHAKRTS